MPPEQPVTLRECIPADAPTLAIIAAATLLEAFAGLVPGDALLAHCAKNHIPAAYLSYLEKPETRAWLAELSPGAAPVGYALLTAPDFPIDLVQPGDLELRRIYLFSKFHGTGAGRTMMDLAIASARRQQATRLLLGVHPDNQRAIAFYRKNGFVQIGTRTFQVGASTFEDPVFALTL
ncbi:ribosomal protein S18 acetylase RimI-like enzyme [Edaphobacter aggregans]|jgi:ribosomal protein S18 acetylase RimI-like enzyme|uniref:Ribosomal protein S18 acetylase RimI-like enzyme n=1 Tax=Edaphobacter aggregans TaxID=570835 RepID=A0A3R9R454_9BACT|nr:GNAT family N-acetyltransferase [Edaphobacter aggregans]RSL17514.1 ribosomal protein S18 acetylase RimI-like enzyme [Edaphobacter aggregans]